nr:hypothetical protein [Lautropia sp.]
MSTLTISIIALVVFVVGAVVLFNFWQARGSRGLPRDGVGGQRDGRHRYGSLNSPSAKAARGLRDERPGSHRWQPGPEQNAWARQRREPTLVADDDQAAAARVPPGIAGRDGASPAETDAEWPRGSYMTADDGVEAEQARAGEAQRAAQARRESAGQAEGGAGGVSAVGGVGEFGGSGDFDGDRWDTGPLPDR